MASLLFLSMMVVAGSVAEAAPISTIRIKDAREPPRRPDPSDARGMARWLVSTSSWGVLSTISVHLHGSPFGNIASFSDGPIGNFSGTPYFFLSRLDPTPNDLEQDSRSSFTLSEAPFGTCGSTDVENPTCARMTLSGRVVELKDESEKTFATVALFSRHPEMEGWPKGHDFRFYKLGIEDIFLIGSYGGAKPLPVEEYYSDAPSPARSV